MKSVTPIREHANELRIGGKEKQFSGRPVFQAG